MVQDRIRRILEIPGYEYVYRDVIYFDEERSFIIFKKRKAVLFSVDVRIRAGVDLSRGFGLSPRGPGRIVVTLPPAEILLADADEESIREYFVEERFDVLKRLDYYDQIDRSKERITADALERGILAKTDERIESLVRDVLSRAGYTWIRFEGPAQ